MVWYRCQECESEFNIVFEAGVNVEYCPACGEPELEPDEDIEEEYEE